MANTSQRPAVIERLKTAQIRPVPTSQSNDFLHGAKASLEALRIIDRILTVQMQPKAGEVSDVEERKFSFLKDKELIKTALINSAGPVTPFLRGFLATLAEYFDSTGIELDLYRWKPFSIMTKDEVNAEVDVIFSNEIPDMAPRFLSLREGDHE